MSLDLDKYIRLCLDDDGLSAAFAAVCGFDAHQGTY